MGCQCFTADPVREAIGPAGLGLFFSGTVGLLFADGSLLAGAITASKSKLVQSWIEIHRDALMADWELAVNGETSFAIEPLR